MTEVDDETFVVAWQRCPTLMLAAKATGYEATRRGCKSCSMRASRLRDRGVKLKRFGVKKSSMEKLKWLAEKALQEVGT